MEADGRAWSCVAPGAQLQACQRFILDPPRVFRGEGSGHGSLSEADIQAIARMFVEETRAALGTTYPVVTQPGPGVTRLRFTLIAVSETVACVSTATRVIPIGAAINLLKGCAGGSGTLTGSVTHGIEASDARTGEVAAAAARELTPGAFDIRPARPGRPGWRYRLLPPMTSTRQRPRWPAAEAPARQG
jgi:hypothetical protein